MRLSSWDQMDVVMARNAAGVERDKYVEMTTLELDLDRLDRIYADEVITLRVLADEWNTLNVHDLYARSTYPSSAAGQYEDGITNLMHVIICETESTLDRIAGVLGDSKEMDYWLKRVENELHRFHFAIVQIDGDECENGMHRIISPLAWSDNPPHIRTWGEDKLDNQGILAFSIVLTDEGQTQEAFEARSQVNAIAEEALRSYKWQEGVA